MKKYISYLIIPILSYWLFELYLLGCYFGLFQYDELFSKGLFVTSLILYSPISIAMSSLVFGIRRGFSIKFPILIGISYFLYNIYLVVRHPVAFTLFYEIVYTLISSVFLLIGLGIKNVIKKIKNA